MKDFTQEEINVLAAMIDFCEENWSAFEFRCEEREIPNTDECMDTIKEKVQE